MKRLVRLLIGAFLCTLISCNYLIDSKEEADALFAVDAAQSSVRINILQIAEETHVIAKNLQNQHGNLWIIHKHPGETTTYRQLLFQNWMKPDGYGLISDGTYHTTLSFDYTKDDTIIVVFRRWNSGLSEAIRQFLSNVGFNDWTSLTLDPSRYQIITERFIIGDYLKGAFPINPGKHAVAAYRGMVSRNGAMMFVNLSGVEIYDFEAYFESGSSLTEFFFGSEEVIVGHRVFNKRLWVNGKIIDGLGYEEFTDAYRLSGSADTSMSKKVSFESREGVVFLARVLEKDPDFVNKYKSQFPSEVDKLKTLVNSNSQLTVAAGKQNTK